MCAHAVKMYKCAYIFMHVGMWACGHVGMGEFKAYACTVLVSRVSLKFYISFTKSIERMNERMSGCLKQLITERKSEWETEKS